MLIAVDRLEQVGHLTKGVQHCLSIGRAGYPRLLHCRAALRLECPTAQQRRGEPREQVESARRAAEHVVEVRRSLRQCRTQRDVRLELGGGDPARCGRGVEIGFRPGGLPAAS